MTDKPSRNIDREVEDSFPASDPPSHTGVVPGSPPGKKSRKPAPESEKESPADR